MPVFTKHGCNTGKCHGSASRQGRLPAVAVRLRPRRRLLPPHPRDRRPARQPRRRPRSACSSKKATGKVPHTGGKLFEPGTRTTSSLAPLAGGRRPERPGRHARSRSASRCSRARSCSPRKGEAQRVVVRAKYSDGTDRDVTRFAVFVGNNDAAATVGEDGVVTGDRARRGVRPRPVRQVHRRARAVIVRPGTPFTVARRRRRSTTSTRSSTPSSNKLHVVPSDVCSDEAFLRRVYLDLIGLLPTPAERERFLADTDPKKREKLIDTLLARDGVPRHVGDEVGRAAPDPHGQRPQPEGPAALRQVAPRHASAPGRRSTRSSANCCPRPAGPSRTRRSTTSRPRPRPQLLAENIAQVFLGTRIQCAQCHNHPFDRWTMDDYYGFAAFFARSGTSTAQDPRELTVYQRGGRRDAAPGRRPAGEAEVPRRRRARDRSRARTTGRPSPTG